MGTTRRHTPTKRDLMIAVWESLDCESVGADELQEIQRVTREKFGAGAVESPAAIARTLSDEGAVLRHPEVLECDARWREQNLGEAMFQEALNFGDLAEGFASIQKLESWRSKLTVDSDEAGLRRLRAAAREVREDCLLVARSETVDEGKRVAAAEIAQWLGIWLKQPEIFADWIDLRKRSSDFVKRFGGVFS
jgi:hypothetical protein